MPPLPHRATAVVDVPTHTEGRARTRALRNNDRDRLLAYLLDEATIDFDLVLYHPPDAWPFDRQTARLALVATVAFDGDGD